MYTTLCAAAQHAAPLPALCCSTVTAPGIAQYTTLVSPQGSTSQLRSPLQRGAPLNACMLLLQVSQCGSALSTRRSTGPHAVSGQAHGRAGHPATRVDPRACTLLLLLTLPLGKLGGCRLRAESKDP